MYREKDNRPKCEDLWYAAQVCSYLNVSRRTLTNLIRGGMPAILIGRRILRFNPEAVRRWAAGWDLNPR